MIKLKGNALQGEVTLIQAAKETLDKATVGFAGRRMDASMADALKNRNVGELVSPEVNS